MTVRVTSRGVTTCDRCRDAFEGGLYWLPEDMAAQVYLTQGSFTTGVGASAGTHAGCGVVDVARFRRDGREWTWAELCQIAAALRHVGFAAWPRERIAGTWERHIHIVCIGCPDLAPAAANQVTAYKNGRDGLAGNAADTLTQAYRNVTWESFQAANPTFIEDHEMNSTQDARLNTVFADVQALKGDIAGIRTVLSNIQVTSNAAYANSGTDLVEDRQRNDALNARLDRLADALAALAPTTPQDAPKPYVDSP